jgi:hypothetical protein
LVPGHAAQQRPSAQQLRRLGYLIPWMSTITGLIPDGRPTLFKPAGWIGPLAANMIDTVVAVAIGLAICAFGVAQWAGIYRSWYATPTDIERVFLAIGGPSPLKWIFAGAGLVLTIVANLFISGSAQWFAVLLLSAGAVSVVSALVFVIWPNLGATAVD